MIHGNNTGRKKQEPFMNNQEDQIKSMENNIVNCINSLEDEIINLKEIVIRNLQYENGKLRHRCQRLEKVCSKYKSDHNALAQFDRQNNVVLSGIPGSISEDVLEESVIPVFADIDMFVESHDTEVWHMFGKPDRQKSRKTIVRFVNRKSFKIVNQKKLGSIDCSKHNLPKIFANENLTPMNESIAYNYRKLKCDGLIHGYVSKDDIVRIKRHEKDSPVKIFYMDKLHGLFPKSVFGDEDDEDHIFLDASQVVNDSVHSRYRQLKIKKP